jgi:opacity protein-like surface antigen
MKTLRHIALSLAVAGFSLGANGAHAQDVPLPPPPGMPDLRLDSGWNTQYGMIFSLQNVFTQAGILGGYGGGIGLQYNLGASRALRLAVDLSRDSTPVVERESTYSSGAGSVTSKTLVVPTWTSQYDVNVSGTYLVRLGTAALSPYLGGGLSLGWNSRALQYEDTITTLNTRREIDNSNRTFDVGLHGKLGLEWRVHRSMSLFAEYGLGVDAFSSESNVQDETVTTATGSSNSKTEFNRNRFFNFSTGLDQGGALGVVAFF